MSSDGLEFVGIADHDVFDLLLGDALDRSDDLNGLSLLLLLDLLFVLAGLVLQVLHDLVLHFLFALVVETQGSTLGSILTTFLAACFLLLCC